MLPPPNPEGPYAVNEAGAGSEEPGVRRHFVWRVFGFVTLQLVLAALMAAVVDHGKKTLAEHYKELIKKLDELKPTDIPSLIWIGILLLCLGYWRRARRGVVGIICSILLFLTVASMAAVASLQCSTWAMLFAVSFTLIITLLFVCVGACTNLDITKYRSFVLIFLWIGIGCVFILSIVIGQKPDVRAIEITVGVIGSLISSVWLLYHLQTVLGGRTLALKPDQVIYGAAQLNLAITLTCSFLMMLKFF